MNFKKSAVYVGTLADGFGLVGIANSEEEIQACLKDNRKDGQTVQLLVVQDPATANKRFKAVEEGAYFILFGSATGGCELFGPFDDPDRAEAFAELERGKGDEWELHSV